MYLLLALGLLVRFLGSQAVSPAGLQHGTTRSLLQGRTPALTFTGQLSGLGPLQAQSLSQFAAGSRYALGLYANGAVSILFDQTIDGFITSRMPLELRRGGVVQIAAGATHAVALTADNRLVAWGNTAFDATAAPVLESGATVKEISAGNQFTLVLLSNSTIIRFGRDIGPPPAGNVKSISAGNAHALALLDDNTVVGWGQTAGANVGPPGDPGPVQSIAAGFSHNVALLQNGTAVAWGSNSLGEINVPAAAQQGVQAVAAGSQLSVALLDSGEVVSWGRPVGFGAGNTGFTAVRAGDVFILGFSGTLATLLPPSPPPPPSPLAPPVRTDVTATQPPPSSGSDGGMKLKPGVIGAIVSIVSGVLLLGVLATLLIRRRRKSREQLLLPKNQDYKDYMDDSRFVVVDLESPATHHKVAAKDGFKLEGLVAGDPFLDVAKQYRWISLSGHPTVAVESGVNDMQLDAMAMDGVSPVLQLSRADVQEQIELVQEGMLGVGGAAIVFQARWPKRFGENGLLAVKVLKDAYHAPEAVRDSFAYESKLLAAIRHPNIVRVYGYCLELPTVCVILELLPCTLSDILYPHKRQGVSSSSAHTSSTLPLGTRLGSHMSALNSKAQTSMHTSSGASVVSTTQQGSSISQITGTGTGQDTSASGAPTATAFVEVKPSTTTMDGTKSMTPQASAIGSIPSVTPLSAAGSMAPSTSAGPALTMMEVLQVSADIAAGLAHLHSKCVSTTATLSQDLVDVKVLEDVPEGEQVTEATAGAAPVRTSVTHIVHRDMKPANVLINSQGRARISDFGLARQHESTTVHTEHVGAGTLTYMAPELLDSRKQGALALKPTNRVDIYSLGIMMWEMIARQKPFSGMSEVQLVMTVCSRRRPPMPTKRRADDENTPLDVLDTSSLPSADLATLPASFDALPAFNDVISACWRHRDLKRPSAEEVSRALNTLLQKAQDKKQVTEGMTTP